VELVAGDLDNMGALDLALAGVKRAFLITPVDKRHVTWCRNFVQAAGRAGRPHVVKFSAMAAAPESSSELLRLHGQSDELLAQSGLPFTILRPNSFHQNMLWSAETVKTQGAFYLPMRDARQSLIDVRDIARVAAAALTETGHEGKIYELTGPESLSYFDVAAKLTSVLGKPVKYVQVPPEAALAGMLQNGMPEWNADAIAGLMSIFATGIGAHTTDTVRKITGHEPIPFEQFAREHAGAFT
jgi:uncharacterized protein YbjT (DUF2867 family)